MPTSPMLDMGPAEIIWGYGESDAAYLGRTLGGIKVTMETNAADILEDQAGDAPVNAVLTGSVMTVEATLTRLSVEQLARAMNATRDGCTVPIENQIGCDLYSLSKALVIKPLCGNEVSTNPCEWVHIYKAYPLVGLDLTWDKDTQRVFPVKFKVFVSFDSGESGTFGTVGMESAATEFGL
jgi:hypothetical protein